ncbi:MAG: DNA-binding response regulator [Alphaproteobacteria bacterium CG_4_9_14_3_um_filter_47_13]|nr:MAG: DNA-binding response regulator [Alphaproteobacteria bacterium CG_4_9_14_3_um_filter_47_13]
MSVLESNNPDVILLDLRLPDIDGLTLMGKIRLKVDIPIIVVSGKDDSTDRVVGLEMGADDYVGKPFQLRELSARIKSVLRRTSSVQDHSVAAAKEGHEDSAPEIIEFENWVMDTGRFEVRGVDKKTVDLTTGEFQLLYALVKSSNRVLSREQLFDLTRDSNYDSFDRAVDIQIGRLRKKLDDDPKTPKLIKTVRGIGYMFIGHIKKPLD